MNATPNVNRTEISQKIPNHYVSVHPSQEAKSYKNAALKATIKAKLIFLSLSIANLVALVLTAIYFPTAAPANLFFHGYFSKWNYEKVYLSYQKEHEKYSELSKHYFEIAKKVDEYATKKLKEADFDEKLQKFGFDSFQVESLSPDLEKSKEEKTSPFLYPIAKFEYWSDLAHEMEGQIEDLEKQIQDMKNEIRACHPSDAKQRGLRIDLLNLSEKKHRIEEEVYLSCKVAAAYNLHIIEKSIEGEEGATPFETFGQRSHYSCYESAIWQEGGEPSYYFSDEDGKPRQPFSKKELMSLSIQELAKRIFNVRTLLEVA